MSSNTNFPLRVIMPSKLARGCRKCHWPAPDHSHVANLCCGFSLLEVLCAILILSVAMVGITEGVTTALRSNKESELQTKAALFAAGLIETLRAEGTLINGTDDGDCGAMLPTCRWNQSVSKSDTDGLHEVKVLIEESASGKRVYELQTLLFEIPSQSTSTQTDSSSRAKSNSKKASR
jgi:prepilin-type N-terminal cleavage/methylation domain-containing protein